MLLKFGVSLLVCAYNVIHNYEINVLQDLLNCDLNYFVFELNCKNCCLKKLPLNLDK